MAKNNIYDLISSELIMRAGATAGNTINTVHIAMSSTLLINSVHENFNQSVNFTSSILNLPAGWTVVPNTHVVTYPSTATQTSSDAIFTGTSVTVILAGAGTTFVVTSTANVTDGVDIITLTGSITITAVLPIYYGVKAAPVTVADYTGLSQISSLQNTFDLTSTSIGRIYVVVPNTGVLDFNGLIDPNGLILPVSDFVSENINSYTYWYTIYDTQLTGATVKTFEILYI